MMKKFLLEALSAIVLLMATLTTTDVDARLPPKLLKAASAASKALYARGYGYSVVPIPQKILLQTNLARREIHHPPRPPRRSKRPRRGKRPPTAYASRYQDYRPTRKRRPPPIREPDYLDQQDIDEDLEYDDRNYKEFDDFVHKHAELYAEGYSTRGKPSRPRTPYKDDEGAYTEHSSPVYVRRRPNIKNWSGSRPSTKLYSASIAVPPRYQREESEDEDEEESNQEYTRASNRWRYREEEDEDRYEDQDEGPPYTSYRSRYHYTVANPDEYYHDRKYQIKKEKLRRPEVKPKIFSQPLSDRQRPLPQTHTAAWKDNDVPKAHDEVKVNRNVLNAGDVLNIYDDRTKNVIRSQRTKWIDPARRGVKRKPSRSEGSKGSTGEEQWRNDDVPTALGLGQWGEEKSSVDETDIITKQNVGLWEERVPSGVGVLRKSPPKEEVNTWVKEHSVGYGIEIEGGQRKRRVENTDPDVVYGQSGHTKPRVPDLGKTQGQGEYAKTRVLDLGYTQGQSEYTKSRFPDFGYTQGQGEYTKTRVPDLGYGQGLQLEGDKVMARQIFHK